MSGDLAIRNAIKSKNEMLGRSSTSRIIRTQTNTFALNCGKLGRRFGLARISEEFHESACVDIKAKNALSRSASLAISCSRNDRGTESAIPSRSAARISAASARPMRRSAYFRIRSRMRGKHSVRVGIRREVVPTAFTDACRTIH